LAELSEQQSYELAFLPGLSTRAEATDLSGRGVGLDAVKSAVEGLGGKISLRSAGGKGSRFTLELPLSVSMANLLLVQDPDYTWLFAAQSAFYAAAFLGYLTRDAARRPLFLNVPYAFCLLNWATVVAFIRLLSGRQRVTWERFAG